MKGFSLFLLLGSGLVFGRPTVTVTTLGNPVNYQLNVLGKHAETIRDAKVSDHDGSKMFAAELALGGEATLAVYLHCPRPGECELHLDRKTLDSTTDQVSDMQIIRFEKAEADAIYGNFNWKESKEPDGTIVKTFACHRDVKGCPLIFSYSESKTHKSASLHWTNQKIEIKYE